MEKKISNKYYAKDWDSSLSDKNHPNWEKAIKIIEDRFKSRYFNPVKELINHREKPIRTNVGFIIISIDCLLIETLNQFFFGLKTSNEKYNRNNRDINFRSNKQAFRDFFNYSDHFPDFKYNEDLINLFYDEIRCGLLHQAESKVNSLINVKKSNMITLIDSSDLSKGIEINRNLFHEGLSKEFNRYIEDLKRIDSVNLEGQNLREMCHRKMIQMV
jgi:hypothetical protein